MPTSVIVGRGTERFERGEVIEVAPAASVAWCKGRAPKGFETRKDMRRRKDGFDDVAVAVLVGFSAICGWLKY